ncbi:MAG: carotenoid biosynthesis protein [Saprospiraceae bacterium]|nr:carotenoid biosynthesis protein [Saprospiraceae bacterium]
MKQSSLEKISRNMGMDQRSFVLIAILVILYFVGLGSLLISGENSPIVFLTPLNLLISFILVFLGDPFKEPRLLLILAGIFLAGLGVEIAGVATGEIFGSYSYGNTLGPKILGTPWIIGVNWALLTYCTYCTIELFFSNWRKSIKAVYGSLTLVLLDFLIEPIAMQLGFWSWQDDIIPQQNYVAWALLSLVFLHTLFYLLKPRTNKVAYSLLILQFIFFGVLNLKYLN